MRLGIVQSSPSRYSGFSEVLLKNQRISGPTVKRRSGLAELGKEGGPHVIQDPLLDTPRVDMPVLYV